MAADRLLARDDFAALTQDVLARGGIMRFTARGSSMRPFIHSDDVLIVHPIEEGQSPQIGDVLLCRLSYGRMVAHRLLRFRPGALLLLGDACASPDGWVKSEDVLGRVVSIERNGQSFLPNRLLVRIWLLLTPLRKSAIRIHRFLRIRR